MTSIASGDADAPTKDMSNWNAIRNIVNGQLGDVNFGTSDVLSAAKTALGTYTAWTAWTPIFTASAGTWTSIGSTARWMQIGKIVHFYIFAAGTTSNTGVINLRFSLPSTPLQTADNIIAGGCLCHYTGSPYGGYYVYNNSLGVINVGFSLPSTSWTNSASNGFTVTGHYEVA